MPKTALAFFNAVTTGDRTTCDRLLKSFFRRFTAIRDRKAGYAVSAIKAGVKLRGFPVGGVRPPLSDLTTEELELLRALVEEFD